LLQKTYTTDFLTKKRIKNNGTVPQYYVENDHPAIIPKDLYMLVQEELIRRRVVHTSKSGKKRTFSSNHCFSQMIYCGECNELYRRVHWNNHGCKSIVWRCISRLEITGSACRSRTVNEELLKESAIVAINKILQNQDAFITQLQNNITKVILESDVTSYEGIEARLGVLQQELLKKINAKENYDDIADEILKLRELQQKSTLNSAARNELLNRITDLQEFIKNQSATITDFDEKLVKRLIEKIQVFDDKLVFEFKTGLTIDIDN